MSINLEPEVVIKATDLGLNISKIAENALKEYIKRLEVPNLQTSTSKDGIGTESLVWWDRGDLNARLESPSL